MQNQRAGVKHWYKTEKISFHVAFKQKKKLLYCIVYYISLKYFHNKVKYLYNLNC